jgi:hypothetical protein
MKNIDIKVSFERITIAKYKIKKMSDFDSFIDSLKKKLN